MCGFLQRNPARRRACPATGSSLCEEEGDSSDHPRDACGLFGVFGNPEASTLTYLGLYALQHRGQESAGIVSSDAGALRRFAGMGLVSDVFPKDKGHRLEQLVPRHGPPADTDHRALQGHRALRT